MEQRRKYENKVCKHGKKLINNISKIKSILKHKYNNFEQNSEEAYKSFVFDLLANVTHSC